MSESTSIQVSLKNNDNFSLHPKDATDLACMAAAVLVGGLTYSGLKKVLTKNSKEGQ